MLRLGSTKGCEGSAVFEVCAAFAAQGGRGVDAAGKAGLR